VKKECDMNKKYAQYGEDYILESLFAISELRTVSDILIPGIL